MVRVDVGDQRDSRVVDEERAIRLIRLNDEQITGSRPGTGTQLGDHSPVDPGRVEAQLLQSHDDHAGARRLAMGPGHRDQPLPPSQPGQRLGTVEHRDAPLARTHQLRVVRPQRTRDHESIHIILHVRRIVADVHANTLRLKCIRRIAALPIRTGDLEPPLCHQASDSAHARAADAHEVYVSELIRYPAGNVNLNDHLLLVPRLASLRLY